MIKMFKLGNISFYIPRKPRDFTCLTNISLGIGFVKGSTTILCVEM